ncbi:uncharacterized protein LOC121880277 isoform X1 [Homarus americanus]|uniref:uncharacterized protein LOC121880277 isoform X1 n=1 Tax=Homarus americanus TaxID=6706 RepID=UPI001C43EFE1|nr:uncharacterized protein LOC121880277 isoform X1 [Homarus americanus]
MDNMVVKELAVVLGALCWVLTLATDGHGCTPWVTTETNNDWQGVNFKNPAKYLWFQADKRRTLTKIYIDFFQNDGSDRVNRDLWFTVPSNTSYYVGVIKPKVYRFLATDEEAVFFIDDDNKLILGYGKVLNIRVTSGSLVHWINCPSYTHPERPDKLKVPEDEPTVSEGDQVKITVIVSSTLGVVGLGSLVAISIFCALFRKRPTVATSSPAVATTTRPDDNPRPTNTLQLVPYSRSHDDEGDYMYMDCYNLNTGHNMQALSITEFMTVRH